MVEVKWIDDKGEFGEDFQILSRVQGDMVSDKLHSGVITIVNQSGFNNIFLFS